MSPLAKTLSQELREENQLLVEKPLADKPLTFCKTTSRKAGQEKLSLAETLKQMVVATPGFEDLPPEELEAMKDSLLEFASIAYSIFQRANLSEEEEAGISEDNYPALPEKEKQKRVAPVPAKNLKSKINPLRN